jgi:hypothetical protein
LPYASDNFSYFKRGVMAHYSSLEGTEREIVVAAIAKAMPTGGGGEVPTVSGGEGRVSSGGESGNSADECASDNENSRTYCFGASTITLGHIKEMVEKGYFVDGREETIPKLNEDKLSSSRISSLSVCACLRILHWQIFY